MASTVEICNLALGWLGAKTIASLDDPSNAAALAKANFNSAYLAVLETRRWTFATKRFNLAQSLEALEWGDEMRFPLDSRILSVYDCPDATEWKVEGRDLLVSDWPKSNGAARVLATVRDVTIDMVSPTFAQALSARLAADLASTITENSSLAERLWAMYLRKLKEASVLDGSQGTPGKLHTSTFNAGRLPR